MQSLPITTDVVSSNPAHGEVRHITQLYNMDISLVLFNISSKFLKWVMVGVMVFNATFNNISVISWWSVLLVEETEVPGENNRPDASH
jgi:hypothetical protein